MKLTWNKVPKKVKKKAKTIIQEIIDHILPGWVESLAINYETSDNDYATCSARYRYRDADITICNDWASLKKDRRRKILLHEAGHIIVAPIMEAIRPMIESVDNREVIEQMISNAEEQTVEDIATTLRHLTME